MIVIAGITIVSSMVIASTIIVVVVVVAPRYRGEVWLGR